MLNTPVRYLKGIGEKRERLFRKLSLKAQEDLLYFFPRRYQDRLEITTISKLEPGFYFLFQGKVLSKTEFKGFRQKNVLKVLISDDTSSILCIWFNQPYLANYFDKGKEFVFYGKVMRYDGILQVNSPEFEENNFSQGILPIYPLKEIFTQRYFRRIIRDVLEKNISKLSDILPFNIRKKHDLINSAAALNNIHFPKDHKILEQAYKRIAFEEFFLISIPFILQRLISKKKLGIRHIIDDSLVNRVRNNFGFELTFDQQQVLEEIKNDMVKDYPMQRLLQGEVGSGKTVVSSLASAFSISGGYQIALMCPTEILAYQHYNNFKRWFLNTGYEILFLSGSIKAKKNIYKDITSGKAKIIIGTHALLEDNVKFNNLGLIIIDEQHKFGLVQRNLLSQKAFYNLKVWPDVLIMTATPIPRTLALTIYGDLDISTIRQLPDGRLRPETVVYNKENSDSAFQFVLGQVRLGRQAYIIYPLINESEKLELKAAVKMYEYLQSGIFKGLSVGLIHGRLKETEQKKIMDEFRDGKIKVLVATSILEIGVDVPNATCMIVEHAERFGLSQLHQLRGRIARSQNNSYFILIANPKSEDSVLRISAICHTCDGFEIAQKDLEIRGPGEFLGSLQHGLSELKVADPIRQIDLLKAAREEAKSLIEKDPNLMLRQNQALKQALEKKMPNYKEFNKLT
ncbi:MAG: ATP-dependent DNA helicase RecG [Candidatus Omnitrophota bacterium]